MIHRSTFILHVESLFRSADKDWRVFMIEEAEALLHSSREMASS